MSFARFGGRLLLITALAGATAARAQDTPPPATRPAIDRPAAARGDPDTMLQRFRDQLASMKLTDDQTQKTEGALKKAEKSLKMLESELQNATQAQRMERIRDIFTELREQINPVLTPEQQQDLRSKLATGAAGQMQRLRQALQKVGLSDEQKEKVQQLFKDSRTRLEAARQEAAGTGQQGADKLRAAGTELREKLVQILSDEQREKLRELMESNAGPATQPAAK